MSKIIKRIASMLMVVVLVLSLSIPVFASDADDPTGRGCVAPKDKDVQIVIINNTL